jgi:hypothetical protein
MAGLKDDRKPMKPIRAWMVVPGDGRMNPLGVHPDEMRAYGMSFAAAFWSRSLARKVSKTWKGSRVLPVEIREVRGQKTK